LKFRSNANQIAFSKNYFKPQPSFAKHGSESEIAKNERSFAALLF